MTRLRVRRTIVKVGVLVFVVLVIGVTYQGVFTALERHRFPRPGGMVDGGGHQLHIYCTGNGAPLVVLEAPEVAMLSAWGRVQPELAQSTRVCSYDRSGLGWSERTGGPYDPARVAPELRTVLAGAGERGPFVLVGQRLGASFARLYAAQYPHDVAALVLIDDPSAADGAIRVASASALVSPWLARVGVLRATRLLSRHVADLPDPSGSMLRAFLNRPDHLTQAARELERADDVVARAERVELDPAVTVRHLQVGGEGPIVVLDRPEQARAVVRATLDVVTRVRAQ